ncbi:hypothetical protein P7J30_01965, partial [Streptococcus suis]
MGLFVYTQKGSIISTVDLPTTEIIEPLKFGVDKLLQTFFVCSSIEYSIFFEIFGLKYFED